MTCGTAYVAHIGPGWHAVFQPWKSHDLRYRAAYDLARDAVLAFQPWKSHDLRYR